MSEHHHDTHRAHGEHGADDEHGLNLMAVSATLHCLTGCAIGEIAGMIVGTAAGLANAPTIALSIALAFFFGYALSTLPLLRSGVAVGTALGVVLAADTVSILSMEVVDNLVMALIPGAMNAGLVNVVFWVGMMVSLTGAFFAAYPVNRFLLRRGKGHALTHEFHGAPAASGPRRLIPEFGTGALVAVLVAFLLGGLVVSVADEAAGDPSAGQDVIRSGSHGHELV